MTDPVSPGGVKDVSVSGGRDSFIVTMLLFCFLSFPGVLSADRNPGRCTLPGKEVLRIGCTVPCSRRYIRALRKVAKKLNYPLRIVTLSRKSPQKIFSTVDGILSPGGHDIDPRYYTGRVPEALKKKIAREFEKSGRSGVKGRARDRFEYGLLRYYFHEDSLREIPFLGICYGMQMLAASKDIPLYVDLQSDLGIPARRRVYDTVELSRESALYSLLGIPTFRAYENHHQAIDMEYFSIHISEFPGVRITGTSHGGKVVEVIEFDGRPAIGVQFHPERSDREVLEAVYTWFLTSACQKVSGKTSKRR